MKTNRFISLLLCVVMIMSLFTGLAGSASADDFITHEVQSGEILMKICEKYGLNYYNCKNAIMQLNGFTNENQLAKLSVGQKLKLPASNAVAGTVSTTTATVTTTTVGGTTLTTTSYAAGAVAGGSVAFYLTPYTVKAGDTLNKICNELGSNYFYYSPVIQGINALANPNQIYAGQVLLIPTASAAGATSAVVSHVVQAGETMSSIANQYGINYQAQRQLINGLNRRDNMDKIYVGQTVLLPGAATTAGSTVVTTTSGTAAVATTSAATSGDYQISISAATNGSPYAVVNNANYATRANAGETVNIVPSPKAGYAVRDIQVVRTDSGTDIPISNYAFTMPNSSVQVTVFYSRGFVINKVASPYGSFDTMIYGTNANTAFYGDEVVLQIYPKTGYNVRLDSGTVTGVYYQKNDLSVEKVYVKRDPADGLYKFKMPNYEIRLTVVFEISTYYDLTSKVTSGGGTVQYFVNGEKTNRALAGQTVTMKMVPYDGWHYHWWKFETTGGGMDTLRTQVKDGKVTKLNDSTYQFVMDKKAVGTGMEVVFVNHTGYKLSYDLKGGHGKITFRTVSGGSYNVTSNDITTATVGQLVEVVFNPDNKYFFNKSDAYHGIDFMHNNSTPVSWEPNPDRFIFQMPASDVKIVAELMKDDSKIYYDLKINYNSSQGFATAVDDATGQPITKALAGQIFRIQASAGNNLRVVGVRHNWGENEEWLWPISIGKSLSVPGLKKLNMSETYTVTFEQYDEHVDVGANMYKIDTASGTDTNSSIIEIVGVPQNTTLKVGDTIKFHTNVKKTGFSVGEVWMLRDSALTKMMSPTKEGGNEYQYTISSDDKGHTLHFLAVRLGEEPVHNVIPEFTIGNTNIINVNGEYLYSVECSWNGGTVAKQIGPVYGMGAKLEIEDSAIKSATGVKVKITIPKEKHKFVGAGGVLYYQPDTLSIRFSDYVLDNYKVMEDPSETAFVYEFWYKADPLTDLNIMVNFKETGTSEEATATGSGEVKTPITIKIDGKEYKIVSGDGTVITTPDKDAVITIVGKTT